MSIPEPLVVVSPQSPNGGPDAFQFDGTAESVRTLERRVRREKPAWLFFEKNEQTGWPIAALNRRFKTGYCTFSGIDADRRETQTAECWADWEKRGTAELPWKPPTAKVKKEKIRDGTFSMVFDTEQLSCVRFGLPRILPQLRRHGVRATFFLTGVVQHVYPGLVAALRKAGHEVGLHGLCHEYLQALNDHEQRNHLHLQKTQLGGSVGGVNFIGRMDRKSVQAFYEEGLQYFVFPLKNGPRLPSAYSGPLWMEPGLFAVPVFGETYGKPVEKVKAEIDRTLHKANALGETRPHLTLLAHPFFDGAKDRLGVLEEILEYLDDKNLQGIPVREALPKKSPKTAGKTLRLRPYGSSGLSGVAERVLNGHAANAYQKGLNTGVFPTVKLL